ncbi:Herpes virus U44 protein [Moritella viscosa]|nr:Herpes virus U44 protein [Moritella viscosa]
MCWVFLFELKSVDNLSIQMLVSKITMKMQNFKNLLITA